MEKANRIIRDAWLRIEIPTAISEQYEIFTIISDSGGVLFPLQSASGRDQFAIWIKALNPHRERRALGILLSGDDVETLTEEQAGNVLQHAVNCFTDQATAYDEGGVLPTPLPINLTQSAVAQQ